MSNSSGAGAAIPPQSPLAALSPELQRVIVSYLEAKEAVHGIGSASKACRSAFLAEIVPGLRSYEPLREEQITEITAHEEEARTRSLVCLLCAMPALTRIRFGPAASLPRIVGRAICRLVSPMANVTTQHHQKPLESLTIEVWEDYYDDELDVESFKAALRTPYLSQLKHIASDPPMLEAVADYLGKEGGRPSLRSLEITGLFFDCYDHEAHVQSFINALVAEGAGPPNLSSLLLEGADESTFAALGVTYAAGGLTNLRSLSITWYGYGLIETDALRSLADAVGTTPHKGGALEEIVVEELASDDESKARWRRAFACSRGS